MNVCNMMYSLWRNKKIFLKKRYIGYSKIQYCCNALLGPSSPSTSLWNKFSKIYNILTVFVFFRESLDLCLELIYVMYHKLTLGRLIFFFFSIWIFVSQTFTNHRTAGEGGEHFFNSSLAVPDFTTTDYHYHYLPTDTQTFGPNLKKILIMCAPQCCNFIFD